MEVQEDVCTTCLIRWSQGTIAPTSPFFDHRCDFTETWLDEDDLEYDDGKLMSVEHPTGTPRSEEMMDKIENPITRKEEPVAVPNYTERIKSQVLAKIGKPPRLDRVEVSRHNNGKYRVNIWEQPEPDKTLAVSLAARIRSSFYLTVSDTGEIIHSNPPLN